MDPEYDNTHDKNAYLLPTNKIKAALQPLVDKNAPLSKFTSSDAAATIIRNKINALYPDEPNAQQELLESKQAGLGRSKHQQFMYNLSNSGKSLAEIQTAWHEYYVALSNQEKHEVWNEFYAANARASAAPRQLDTPTTPATTPKPKSKKRLPERLVKSYTKPIIDNAGTQSIAALRLQLIEKVRTRSQVERSGSRLRSLFFGLALGSSVLLVLLFGFFNERFIAPFITPSRNVSATPIIIDPNSTSVGPEPRVIIPKINVEIPVVYDEPSTDEKALQKSLERGVVHYASSVNPGEKGNSVIVGHSSNNILNKGKYKFAFVLLNRLETGDTFYLTKDGKRYAYRIYEKRIVKPTDISVLENNEKPATVTLITCDPPGTSINRLVVVGEQISPEPGSNTASTAVKPPEQPKIVPGNSPSLWDRIKSWFS